MLPNLTALEVRAIAATSLPAFPVNIDDIRRNVAKLLGEVGRYGFFDEYTVHNYSHVHSMLDSMSWIVEPSSIADLSDAECFILVISAYFHDLGLLITKDEYQNRDKAALAVFAESQLFKGEAGEDYQARLLALDAVERDRFIYQEYVRFHHGARVRNWLEERVSTSASPDNKVVEEIQKFVGALSPTLRREIAKVCESHNLDDLSNSEKYKVSQPFGNSEAETANIQYIALVLRTADLLDITQSRAPSALMRIVNPTDPVSQIEWHKQNAVTRVRRKMMADENSKLDEAVKSDTIEVFAHFFHAEGFFGLTSYLRYAEAQLEQSYRIADEAVKKHGSKYEFPWRKIDEKNVEAEGFIPRQFGFELDQRKILTLLTGHTLYNDSTVVIRELVQNAVDAVRLQWKNNNPEKNGCVEIKWNSKSGELTVADNGTGMTQDTVERHLLKVGSSKYQDEQFKKLNSDFHPISRFGIGVLTAFMVANTVEIVTVSPEEKDARQISLRSVNGKYLIRLLDRDEDADANRLSPHGSEFKLFLRKSAKRTDVLETVRRWIVFPRCRVSVTIDDNEPVEVGYESPKKALEAFLGTPEGKFVARNRETRVVETQVGPLKIAYAIAMNEFFKDWSLLNIGEMRGRTELRNLAVGICVEGIAVDFNSPGFAAPTIVAIADATGPEAPRTNVARSALEDTEQRSDAIALLYNEYFKQVADEVERLSSRPEYSLSWAVGQASFIASPLTSLRGQRLNPSAYDAALAKTPLFLLETAETRLAVSLEDLKGRARLWIVDSSLVRSIESLVREAPTNITARSIIDLTHGKDWLPEGDLINSASGSVLAGEVIERAFDVVEFVAKEKDRRLDLRIEAKTEKAKWTTEAELWHNVQYNDVKSNGALFEYFRERGGQRRSGLSTYFPLVDIPTDGLEGYGAVHALRGDYLLPGGGIAALIASRYASENLDDAVLCAVGAYIWGRIKSRQEISREFIAASADKLVKQLESDLTLPNLDWLAIKNAIDETDFRFFDPFAWSRREAGVSIFDLDF